MGGYGDSGPEGTVSSVRATGIILHHHLWNDAGVEEPRKRMVTTSTPASPESESPMQRGSVAGTVRVQCACNLAGSLWLATPCGFLVGSNGITGFDVFV